MTPGDLLDRTIFRAEMNHKIGFLSFLAILAVIAQHCRHGSELDQWVVPWLTLWAVPWFFIVSGYFFHKSLEKYSGFELCKKKIVSLLIPYAIWCLIGWCLWQPLLPSEPLQAILKLLGLTRSCFPVGNLPLWYTRALILLMLMTGLVYWFASKISNQQVRNGIVCMAVGGGYIGLRTVHLGISPGGSVVFWLVGFVAASYDLMAIMRRVGMTRHALKMAVLLAVLSCLTRIMMPYCTDHLSRVIDNTSVLLAIGSMLLLVQRAPQKMFELPLVVAITTTVPFVYFFHGPFIFGVEKVFVRAFGMPVELNAYYISKTLFHCVISVCIALSLSRLAPRLYSLLTGGRNVRRD